MKASEHDAARTPTGHAGLTGRLALGAVLAIGAFVVVNHGALTLLAMPPLTALIAAAAGAALVATAALRLTIAPWLATHADLQVRYEAAVADALRDPLTSLGNHRAFHEDLEREVAAAVRYNVPLTLALIDLDEFKAVNDAHGHGAGDEVLRRFGQRLRSGLRLADRTFRIGGDEFAVLLPHTDLDGAQVVMRRILAQSLQPAVRSGTVGPVSFSAGLSAAPVLATGPAQLFSQADAALYAAKRGGRTDIALFEPGIELTPVEMGSASSAIAEVIAGGLLTPVFQPIVSLVDGSVIGVEGLIRTVPPAPFGDPGSLFEAAEVSGRLTALDLACIDTIVAHATGLPSDQFLSVNLAPPTLEAPEFNVGAILGILGRHGFPPDRLVIELTERHQLIDPDRVRARIDACRRAGIRFAADDIGAGNAGLRLLADVRFDILKVDLTLVQRSSSNGQYGAVVETVVDLARRTGAIVIAEGIETTDQLGPLQALGIVTGQGYLLGRPAPLGAAPATAAEVPAIGMASWRQSMGLTVN
ncbi:MAG: EAL domain-containing protein [Chloroflexi bacterium]|nr:EAL domain-containing protein [Chloroflexota bacterium]